MADICAILNLHSEGILAHSSVISIMAAKARAEAEGMSVEVLAVADCPDEETIAYLETAERLGARILITDVHDLGLARNVGIAATSAAFVAFLDGDDMWTENWLSSAYAAAMKDSRAIAWHPEANLYFGSQSDRHWTIHPDMDEHTDTWTRLGLQNLWTSLSFAARDVFLEIPYSKSDLGSGFGYEDWHWNAQTVDAGVIHKIVPGTVHLIRVRSGSLLRATGSRRALVTPTDLFRNRLQADKEGPNRSTRASAPGRLDPPSQNTPD